MRIIKIYVENFGCLNKYTLNFENDITEILADNGFGKTTLANFIKAMFYGFTNSKKSIEDNDRLRYAPWQGSNFGGYLDFEHEGKKYRIERFFNPSSATKDSFKLYDLDTNKLSKDYSKNIGEELFKIDIEGYIRSSYIPQTDIEWSTNKKLSQNLTNMLETSGTEDITQAIKTLENESKKYVKTAGRGLIGDTQSKIVSLEEKLEMADLSKSSEKELKLRLDKNISDIEKLEKELTSIKEQIKQANKQSQKEAIYNHYKDLTNNKEVLRKELDELNSFFKNQYPTKEQIAYNYELLEKLSFLQVEINKFSSRDYIDEEYNKLKNYFNIETKGQISEELIKDKFKENDELKMLSIEREEIAKKMDKVDDKLENETVLTQTHKMIYILLGFFSAILLIPGIVFVVDIFNGFQVIKFIIGILLLIFGIAFGVTALIIFLVRMSRNHKKLEKYKELQEQCASEKQYLVELYKDLDGKFLTLSSKIKEFVSNYESTEISLISRLKEDDDYLIQLNNIYNNYKTYQKLEIEFNKRNERSICVKQEYDQIKKSLDSFTKYYLPYVDSFQALKQIQMNFDNYLSTYKKYEQALIALDEFLKNNVVEQENSEHIYNIQELEKEETKLENKIKTLNSEKLILENNIKNNELIVDSIFELQTQIDVEKELLSEYNKKYYIITKTIEYLKSAEDKLSSNYLSKLQDKFNKYLSTVLKTDDYFEFSSELEITKEENGSKKEVGFFSSGYQDIIYFCARLALLDTLFSDIKPTLVLDDPFTNLDEGKLEMAVSLLKEVSSSYQIIYLTCHNSRNVK